MYLTKRGRVSMPGISSGLLPLMFGCAILSPRPERKRMEQNGTEQNQ